MADRFEVCSGGIRFYVRLTPKGGRNRIEDWSEDAAGRAHLKIRVAAPPEDNKANKALIVLLSEHFELPKSAICIVRGHTSRLKLIEIEGNRSVLTKRLEDPERRA
jgi:uncharacterized protein (TIGR00251 family)